MKIAVINLRPAIPADVPRIVEIVDAAYGPYVERLGGPPRPLTDDYDQVVASGTATVAERDGEVVGLIVLVEDDEGFSVDNVAVHPSHHGTGVGHALLEYAEAQAPSAGYDAVSLLTHELMTENIALYERIGYVESTAATTAARAWCTCAKRSRGSTCTGPAPTA